MSCNVLKYYEMALFEVTFQTQEIDIGHENYVFGEQNVK